MSTAKTTGWVGWSRFAGVIILVSGIFSVLQGLVALIGPNSYYVLSNGELFLFDLTGWGWWNLIVDVLLVLTAISLFAGQLWARIVAIILAVISAVVQLFLIPAQPWWSTIVIAMDVLIIYALTAHGEELRADR